MGLYYKPEGLGFDPPIRSLGFYLTESFQPHYGTGIDTASKTNE
jgi:hypothetical protein